MQVAIGVDISKDHLDTCHAGTGAHRRFSNTTTGLTTLCRWASKQDVAAIVFEGETGQELIRWINSPSNGAYHRDLERSLARRGLTFAKVNPRQARRFAEAIGQVAKTDKVPFRDIAPQCTAG